MNQVEIVQGDITKQNVDIIVNAANSSLLGGGGVDGAIHRAAGPKLLEECRNLNGCKTGSVKVTAAYDLPAKYIIHAVGPIWHGGHDGEPEKLASCYRLSLAEAHRLEADSIAFPAISCGIYGFPADLAAKIVYGVFNEELNKKDKLQVKMICFDTHIFNIFATQFNKL